MYFEEVPTILKEKIMFYIILGKINIPQQFKKRNKNQPIIISNGKIPVSNCGTRVRRRYSPVKDPVSTDPQGVGVQAAQTPLSPLRQSSVQPS